MDEREGHGISIKLLHLRDKPAGVKTRKTRARTPAGVENRKTRVRTPAGVEKREETDICVTSQANRRIMM